jgi:predicted transcriptional regulator
MIGFDGVDTKILAALDRKSNSAAGLGRIIGINRMTVTRRLKRLAALHVVQKHPVTRREDRWTISKSRIRGKGDIHIYRGRDLARAYSYIRSIPKHSIMYALIGTQGVALSAHKYEQYGTESIFRLYQRRHIVQRTLNGAMVDTVHQRFAIRHTDKVRRTHTLVSSHQLLTKLHAFDGPGICASTPKFILMVDEAKEVAIVIKNKAIVELMYGMMELSFASFDYNDDIRQSTRKKVIDHILAHHTPSAQK